MCVLVWGACLCECETGCCFLGIIIVVVVVRFTGIVNSCKLARGS